MESQPSLLIAIVCGFAAAPRRSAGGGRRRSAAQKVARNLRPELRVFVAANDGFCTLEAPGRSQAPQLLAGAPGRSQAPLNRRNGPPAVSRVARLPRGPPATRRAPRFLSFWAPGASQAPRRPDPRPDAPGLLQAGRIQRGGCDERGGPTKKKGAWKLPGARKAFGPPGSSRAPQTRQETWRLDIPCTWLTASLPVLTETLRPPRC